MVAWMTSSEATRRSQSSRGHLSVAGDSATRLVEPDPPLPGKTRCGQRRGERRFGRPIARAKAPWRTGPGHPADMAAPVICCPKRPRTPATASRRPVIYTPGGRLHECAGGIMHADRFRSASPLRNPTRTLQAAGRTRSGVSHIPAGEDSLWVPIRHTRFTHSNPAQNPRFRREAPSSARTRSWPTRRRQPGRIHPPARDDDRSG